MSSRRVRSGLFLCPLTSPLWTERWPFKSLNNGHCTGRMAGSISKSPTNRPDMTRRPRPSREEWPGALSVVGPAVGIRTRKPCRSRRTLGPHGYSVRGTTRFADRRPESVDAVLRVGQPRPLAGSGEVYRRELTEVLARRRVVRESRLDLLLEDAEVVLPGPGGRSERSSASGPAGTRQRP